MRFLWLTALLTACENGAPLAHRPSTGADTSPVDAGLAEISWALDADQDGSPGDVDCNDADPAVHPGAVEICASGVDEDCDPTTDCDAICLDRFDYTLCDEVVSAPEPVLHWSFAGGGTGARVGRAGTAIGAPQESPGMVGAATSLDGGSAWSLDPLNLPADRFSFVAWVKTGANHNPDAYHFVASSGVGSTSWTGAALYLADGIHLHALTESGSKARESFADGDAVCAGKWSQVAMTFDAGALSTWVDGGEAGSTLDHAQVTWGSNPFVIGTDPHTAGRGLVADVDEVRVFAAGLTGADLETLRRRDLCARATPL